MGWLRAPEQGPDGLRCYNSSAALGADTCDGGGRVDVQAAALCGFKRHRVQDRRAKKVRCLEVSGRRTTLMRQRRRMVCDNYASRFLEDHPAFEGALTAHMSRRVVADAKMTTFSAAALSTFLMQQGHRRRKGVKVVVSDSSKTYKAAIDAHKGHARLVLDRFHVIRRFAVGLALVRRDIQRRPESSKPAFDPEEFRARFTLLRRGDTLTDADRVRPSTPTPACGPAGRRCKSSTASTSPTTTTTPSRPSNAVSRQPPGQTPNRYTKSTCVTSGVEQSAPYGNADSRDPTSSAATHGTPSAVNCMCLPRSKNSSDAPDRSRASYTYKARPSPCLHPTHTKPTFIHLTATTNTTHNQTQHPTQALKAHRRTGDDLGFWYAAAPVLKRPQTTHKNDTPSADRRGVVCMYQRNQRQP